MSKEALKLALEYLINLQPILGNGLLEERQLAFIDPHIDCAIIALREALAEQPAHQEPVKVKTCDTCQFGERCNQWSCKNHSLWKPVQPAQCKPLTDADLGMYIGKELSEYINGAYADIGCAKDQLIHFARAIEAAHGIKEKNT